MLNTPTRTSPLPTISAVVGTYLVVVLATLVTLAVLSATAPHQATSAAWGHGIIVAVFAVVLPLRLRSARRGSVPALRAVGIIAAVLFLVNVVEVLIPGFMPTWMTVQMVLVAVLMLAVIGLVVRERV